MDDTIFHAQHIIIATFCGMTIYKYLQAPNKSDNHKMNVDK